jgi:hypothetical protein
MARRTAVMVAFGCSLMKFPIQHISSLVHRARMPAALPVCCDPQSSYPYLLLGLASSSAGTPSDGTTTGPLGEKSLLKAAVALTASCSRARFR